MASAIRIAVVGLGYVGLPLAVALARRHDVVGFDIDSGRVEELGNGLDRTHEIDRTALLGSTLKVTTDADDLRGSEIFIITVPTPVDL